MSIPFPAASASIRSAKKVAARKTAWPRPDERHERANAWFASLRTTVEEDRAKRGSMPDLDRAQILEWADAFRARTGEWPGHYAGPIPEAPGETWMTVEAALTFGLRGLSGHSTIRRLLAENGRRYHPNDLGLTVPKILAWVDTWHARTGAWPLASSGAIPDSGELKWSIVDWALRYGRSGLPIESLARLLARERGVRNQQDLPPFDVTEILRWADAHYTRTGEWPKRDSGPILECPDESWRRVDAALLQGMRGLPGGSSLALLLEAERGVRNIQNLAPLTEARVLDWADAHHARTGKWPHARSGPICDGDGAKWRDVANALERGLRGLPGGTSLARLLTERRGIRNDNRPPRLTVGQILGWADAHHARSGRWPMLGSGPVADAPGERWSGIDASLRRGTRGLPGGSSLCTLLEQARGCRKATDVPRLHISEILSWAEAHRARHGRWPSLKSGPIPEAEGTNWKQVHEALCRGLRGLPGGSSLASLFAA